MQRFKKWIKDYNEALVILILVAGLFLAFLQLSQNARDSRYRYLTGVWNDIMKESIKYPSFNDKSRTLTYAQSFNSDEQIQYNNYARWIGGFIEDLYVNKYLENGDLYYEPWVKTILETHQTWFVEHKHYYEFTDDFYERLCEMEQQASKRVLKDATSSPKNNIK